MNLRPLGNTGLHVSEIGFGAWGIGGNVGGSVAYGPTDDEASVAALRRAVDRGVNFFDTAAFYGYGHSEQLLGHTLSAVRDQVVFATKAGFVDAAGRQDFSPHHLRESLEGSLRRLRTEWVDLYQLHSPSIAELEADERIVATMEALVREGKTRTWGISVRNPDDGRQALARWTVPCLQVNLNLLDQRAADSGLLDLCAARRVGVIARTPLCFGFLTGRYEDIQFDFDDHRRNWPPEQVRRWGESWRLFAERLTEHRTQTPAQLALRFCLSYPSVSTAIPGMLTAAQVEENATASDLGVLDADALRVIAEIYRGNTFFVPRKLDKTSDPEPRG
jgi:aryl-alcohol dehydrogenase-like predicted oxidoreductase